MARTEYAFDAIGTRWQIAFEAVNLQNILSTKEAVAHCVTSFESVYSRFRDDSLIGQIAKHAETYVLPAQAEKMFSLYRDLYQLTQGAFTPLIGQALVDAGYDRDYSLQPKHMDRVPSWDEALIYQFPTLVVKYPVQLDFGAAGKGYLIDLVCDVLRANDVVSFCVDAGGDIFYQDTSQRLMKIGLEHPAHKDQVIGVASILNQSICGSAGNRRQWGQYTHIIDPKLLTSPKHILATWVIAKEALLADALTTCLFFVSSKVLASAYNFEYAVIYDDYSLESSPMFPGEFFTH